MVSFANGGLSGEVSNKRPLENGYVPKYKPRKVSAIRDFPPGCGRNVVRMDLKPEENGSNGAPILEADGVKNSEVTNSVVANGFGNSKKTTTMEANGVESAEMVKLSGIPNSVIENGVVSNGIGNSYHEVECQSHEAVHSTMDVDTAESLDALVEKVVATVNGVDNLMMEIAPIAIELPNDVECQTHETVNNPIEVERVESLDALVGEVTTTTTTMNGFLVDVEVLMTETTLVGVDTLNDMKSDSSKEGTAAGGQTPSSDLNVEEPKSVLDAGFSVKPETSVKPKDKYRRRRVSAVRDFPPHCGRNVILPTEEEKQPVTSGDVCLDRIEKVEVGLPEAVVSRNGSDKGSLVEMLMTFQKECLDGTEKVHAEVGTETLKDGAEENAGTNVFEDMLEVTVKGGLGVSEDCYGPIKDSNMEDNGGPMGKDMVEYPPDRNDNARPPHGEVSSGNELQREVVHGVMAAPNCPWRKAKVAINNSGGKTSGSKVKRSRKKKSKPVAFPDSVVADESPRPLSFMGEKDSRPYDEYLPETPRVSMSEPLLDDSDRDDSAEPVGNKMVVYSPGENDKMRPSPQSVSTSADEVDNREVVHGLMAPPRCPRVKIKFISINSGEVTSGEKKEKKTKSSWQKKAKAVAKKSIPAAKTKLSLSEGPSNTNKKKNKKKRKEVQFSDDEHVNPGAMVLADEEGYDHRDGMDSDSPPSEKTRHFDIHLPPFGPNSNSGQGDVRHKVRETLRLFHVICRKILQQQEANSETTPKQRMRIDLLAANVIKEKGKEVNTGQLFLGPVPGVEVGDEFQYRVELAVVGIHRLYQAGIDLMKLDNGMSVATSIVSSGAYADDVENADVLIYSGQGGNFVGVKSKNGKKVKEPEDQKLEKGNLALRNSILTRTPVRVVRGWKDTKVVDPSNSRAKLVPTYVYDGLYTVMNFWTEKGPHDKKVFMFELRRNPGQPDLAWKELKKASKSKTRPGVCVHDISEGKEALPICAVNTINDEKPPPFIYTPKMMYPDWHRPISLSGCDCVGKCSDSRKCRCAVRNGGEIPYNRNGAIVETKPLVYECGPHCKCPPSCYNKVTQRGIKFQLEIFKTESRGWGVRPLTSIPSGSFICEYAGELLEDKEAEKKIGNDEYLFDIGHNYNDSSLKHEEDELALQVVEEGGGYTIDAGHFGNIGRFVNHSCSPNLYAQNVIYDHDDKKMPHVMLFAMENIPPLQELTYHYNYTVGSIRDSDGNIKVKKCYCGSAECSGRLY